MDKELELFRHTLATLAYRANRAMEGAPPDFAGFNAAGREPVNILAHMANLLVGSLAKAKGIRIVYNSEALSWPEETERFFNAIKAFDDYLTSGQPVQTPLGQIFQGPISDALTHVGQLAMLRRLAGSPIRGENYFLATITPGRVTAEQPPPAKPF
jgi:hypothetical protein